MERNINILHIFFLLKILMIIFINDHCIENRSSDTSTHQRSQVSFCCGQWPECGLCVTKLCRATLSGDEPGVPTAEPTFDTSHTHP